MRLWYLSHRRPAKALASLRIRAVSPEPSLFTHMKYGSRQRVRPKIRHLAPLDGCICAFQKWVYGGRKVPWSHEMAHFISLTQASKKPESPVIFLSYQWSKQPQVKTLYQRLTSKGYTVWMDVYQMGGGDSLYEKIDKGIRGCKVLVSCVTKKYTLSANCRREVSLADALMTPIIPLLLEQTEWPPDGPMRNTFAESDYFNCYKDVSPENTWKMEIIDQLISTINQIVQQPETVSEKIEKRKQTVGSNKCNIEDKSRSTTVTKPRLEKTPGVAQSSKSTSSAIQKRNKVSTPAKH